MSIIGTFTRNEKGFTGAIKTLCLDVNAKFVPTPKDSEKGPDFRVLVGNIEFRRRQRAATDRDASRRQSEALPQPAV